MKLQITLFQDEDGMFITECPAIPGCVSQGKTVGHTYKALEVSEQTFYLSLNTILNREKLRLQENILNVPVNINGYIV